MVSAVIPAVSLPFARTSSHLSSSPRTLASVRLLSSTGCADARAGCPRARVRSPACGTLPADAVPPAAVTASTNNVPAAVWHAPAKEISSPSFVEGVAPFYVSEVSCFFPHVELCAHRSEDDVRMPMRRALRRPPASVGSPSEAGIAGVTRGLRCYCFARGRGTSLLASGSRGSCFRAAASSNFDPALTYSEGSLRALDSSKRSYVSLSSLPALSSPSLAAPVAGSHLIKTARTASLPSAPGKASYSTANNAASFDIFQRIKDSSGGPQQEDTGATGKKRKPSERVLRLVDEIMNLTLIEAADLCDMCQEKLAERSGGPAFSAAAAAGRSPFPHPAAMFAGMGMPGTMPTPVPVMGVAPTGAAASAAAQPSAPPGGSAAAEPSTKAEKKDAAPAMLSIKLTGFDPAKKVAVVKEVRAITALGLKESKDLVEQSPKVLKKGVPAAEAEALKKKLEAAGAQVALE